jgi:hypothetical protein
MQAMSAVIAAGSSSPSRDYALGGANVQIADGGVAALGGGAL